MEDPKRNGGEIMFGDKFKRKYALSDKGVHNTKMGMLWTIVVNLLMMGSMGLLYFMMQSFISTISQCLTRANVTSTAR